MHHFGEPLVASTTDFGARSEPPANPELLDWLASEFIRSGWSVKHLHRVMVLSGAYQQASVAADVSRLKQHSLKKAQSLLTSAATGADVDPDNRLLWHFPRRRLDLEAMRDSLLFISGRLDTAMGGRPVDVAGDPFNQRRTVYGLVDRQNVPAMFRAFDFAVPDQCAERRPRTSAPQQALFALNSPFVMEQAHALAAQPEIASESVPARRVDALFRRVLGRHATGRETSSALRFLEAAEADPHTENPEARLTPWEQLAQVLLVSNEAVFVD